MEFVDYQFGVGQILSKGMFEGLLYICIDLFYFVSIW